MTYAKMVGFFPCAVLRPVRTSYVTELCKLTAERN